ncbi:unnamed protein product [Agarophyton chilense]|eukprot:gb/GEZJ01000956.1/.p1 GENE.gb/GEZJ01000956.1/~~gb/GEZJ01000956.1/.p1  ORF type:complete len:508 (-),score=83.16 gb/GEZJ01000956.1/:419-1942(-)
MVSSTESPSTSDSIFYQKPDQPDMTGAAIFDISSSNIFNRDNHKIHIRIHQLVFDKVLSDGAADIDSGYGLVDEFCLDGHKIENVGIKVRGNTSAANIKRQFKFKFDAEETFAWREGSMQQVTFPVNDDRRFFGEQGFSVRASQNDPSRIRETLAGKVFREATLGEQDPQRPWRTRGALVYRTAFATLYVTNGRTVEEGYDSGHPEYRVPFEGKLYDPKGLYVITENIDKTFLKTRFERFDEDKVKGYLFQADKGMAYFQKDKYSRTGWKCELVKGKKPKDEEDFLKADEKMLDLIDFLDEMPHEEKIRSRFDMDSLNGYLGGALLATHWDSLAANRNNDFMFYLKRDILDDEMNPVLDEQGEPREEKKWYMITWDLDNTLWDRPGGSEVQDPYKSWFSNYLYDPARKEECKTRLLENIFDRSENEQIRSAYRHVLRDLLDGFYSESEYEKEVDSLMKRTGDAIEETRREVAAAEWQKEWGERNNPQDFEEIKSHARVRRSKVGGQL